MSARAALRWLLLVPLAAALVVHSLVYDFVCDDAFISFVYSRNLAEHGQLVFNLGDRVEGYTNFLWTVLLAGLMKLGIAPEIAARVLGTGFGVATLFVVFRLSERLRGRASAWDYLPPALLAASSGYACWCSGGLETQMFTCFVALGVSGLASGRPALSGVAFGLGALTRPEGVLVVAVAGAHWLACNLVGQRRLRPRRPELVWAGCFLALYLPYFAWRWWYYGWPFPNTYYVKAGSAPSAEYGRQLLAHGLYYVWQWAVQSKAIYAVPLAAAAVWKHPRFGSFALALTAAYLAYAAKVGGDFMGLHRFVMPLFITTAVLAGIGAAVLADLARARAPGGHVVAVAAALAALAAFGYSQIRLDREAQVARADNGIDRPGYLRLYAHDRELLGKALAPHIRPDDFSIVGGVGVQPYYARMRAIDVFGLVSEDVAHNEPPTNPRPGHQKWAHAERLLAYHPSFVFHCYSLHRLPDDYALCGEAGIFERAGYEPVTIHVPGLRERGEYYTFLKRKDRAWP
jgi:arabinofuranosyltransferase